MSIKKNKKRFQPGNVYCYFSHLKGKEKWNFFLLLGWNRGLSQLLFLDKEEIVFQSLFFHSDRYITFKEYENLGLKKE